VFVGFPGFFHVNSLWKYTFEVLINALNAKLNPICHLLALLGAHHILHVSRIRVNPQPANVENMVSS